MCKKSLVLIILVLVSNLAFGQAHTITGDTNSVSNVSLARRNAEIDENKYAHPSDFLYEEKVEDVAPEYAEENAQEQKLQEEEAAEQAAYSPDNSDL